MKLPSTFGLTAWLLIFSHVRADLDASCLDGSGDTYAVISIKGPGTEGPADTTGDNHPAGCQSIRVTETEDCILELYEEDGTDYGITGPQTGYSYTPESGVFQWIAECDG